MIANDRKEIQLIKLFSLNHLSNLGYKNWNIRTNKVGWSKSNIGTYIFSIAVFFCIPTKSVSTFGEALCNPEICEEVSGWV